MDWSFAVFYSLGGAVMMIFLEPLIWLPALVIGRSNFKSLTFLLEGIVGVGLAIIIGWYENSFASMTELSPTVFAIQIIRPALAELLAIFIAHYLWVLGRNIRSKYFARKIPNAPNN
jgi:hypothetical protein